MDRRRILVVAGSDSSGGAGLEADQKVIAAHGCYAMTVTTALTAQNTQGVNDVLITPSSFVQKQMIACFDDIGVDVIKTGMLASADNVSVVATALRQQHVKWSVIDPVMVSTSGAQLLPEDAVRTLRKELFPLVALVTPNLPEALLILKDVGQNVDLPKGIQDLAKIAQSVQKLGPRSVLLKGGHLPFTRDGTVDKRTPQKRFVVDVLCDSEEVTVFESDYIESKNTHGTGCSLASAIASRLAQGHSLVQATTGARQYVEAGIKTSASLGKGNGPLNHFHSIYTLPFAPDHFLPYLLTHPRIQPLWQNHIHHPFVHQLSRGTLPLPAFKHYLTQDYLYLVQFARANALASYKSADISSCVAAASIVAHIHKEMSLHLSYCADFGLSKADVEATPEDLACTAYTRYVLDVGMQQDFFALQLALAPCLLGYGQIAEDIVADPDAVTGEEGNRYWRWVETYIGEDFQAAVAKGREVLEAGAVGLSVRRVEELVEVFAHAIKMEIGFWDMGLAHAGEGEGDEGRA